MPFFSNNSSVNFVIKFILNFTEFKQNLWFKIRYLVLCGKSIVIYFLREKKFKRRAYIIFRNVQVEVDDDDEAIGDDGDDGYNPNEMKIKSGVSKLDQVLNFGVG